MIEVVGFFMVYKCFKIEEKNIFIGEKGLEIDVYILDENRNIVKDGEYGKLYIDGKCLCSMYYKSNEF